MRVGIKKAESQRIDAFELCHLRRFLRVPWHARRSNQSILKEISTEYSLKGLMLKLELQYFGHLMQRTDSFEKTLMMGKAGGEGDDRGWDGWMASLTQWTWVWASSASWWWARKPGMLQSMGLQRVRHDWVTELNWTEDATTAGASLWAWRMLRFPVTKGWGYSKRWHTFFRFTDTILES